MANSNTHFVWTDKHVEACALLAAGELEVQVIAAKLGVARETLWKWRQIPEFIARLNEHQQRLDAECYNYACGAKRERVRRLQLLINKIERVIEQRAKKYASDAEAIGGDTGMVIHRVRYHKTGSDYVRVTETEFDAALVRELRELHKQLAIEMGQWTEKRDVTSGGVPIKVYAGVDPSEA